MVCVIVRDDIVGIVAHIRAVTGGGITAAPTRAWRGHPPRPAESASVPPRPRQIRGNPYYGGRLCQLGGKFVTKFPIRG